MSFRKLIEHRQSVRRYQNKPIEKEILQQLIEAVHIAPSACNSQPWKLIIVDEPTAGLDPMERNRFYNLLSEIGENTVVILSTHIVEDVSTLCNQMAIIGKGEVLLTGKPGEIEAGLNERVWEKQIEKHELQDYEDTMNVISSRFHLGKLMITVVADDLPDGNFWSKAPSLEDAYFNVLYNERSNLAATVMA